MKKLYKLLGMLAMALTFGLVLAGCDNPAGGSGKETKEEKMKKLLAVILASMIAGGVFAQEDAHKRQPFDMLLGLNLGFGITPNMGELFGELFSAPILSSAGASRKGAMWSSGSFINLIRPTLGKIVHKLYKIEDFVISAGKALR